MLRFIFLTPKWIYFDHLFFIDLAFQYFFFVLFKHFSFEFFLSFSSKIKSIGSFLWSVLIENFWIHKRKSKLIFLGIDFLVMIFKMNVVRKLISFDKRGSEEFIYCQHEFLRIDFILWLIQIKNKLGFDNQIL